MLPAAKLDMSCVTEEMVRDLYEAAFYSEKDEFERAYQREQLRKQEAQDSCAWTHCLYCSICHRCIKHFPEHTEYHT